jgi:intracellular sulfur oxidation DsrE/DsrF family protein
MAKYLFVESRDPFEHVEVGHQLELVASLAKDGNQVTLFLVQNGVLPARKSVKSDALTRLAQGGVEVLADDFSLRARGIDAANLASGVKAAPIDVVVDQLAEGRKAVWH